MAKLETVYAKRVKFRGGGSKHAAACPFCKAATVIFFAGTPIEMDSCVHYVDHRIRGDVVQILFCRAGGRGRGRSKADPVPEPGLFD